MKNAILPILLVVNLIVAALVGAQFFKGGDAGSFDPDEETKIAAALANRGLYAAAEGRLRRVSDNPSVSDDKRAGALYQIGTWHLERAKDPERALAAFVELRERFDKTDLAREAAKKELACLDQLGRPLDAKGVLDETAPVDAQKSAAPREGVILAKIGDREITSGDLDAEIRTLPPEVQSKMTDKTARRQLLQSLVARELLFDSAQSAGLDKDPEVLRGLADAKKGLMVTKLIEQRSGDKVRVDDVDIKNYYEAHKDKLKDKDGKVLPFEKVKDQLARSLAAEKQSAVVQEMISELGTSRGVEIFDDRL